MRRALPLLLTAVALAGCGNERQKPENPVVGDPPTGAKTVSYPKVGMELAVPTNWQRVARPRPGVFTMVDGQMGVAAYAYDRTGEELPKRGRDLSEARKRLVDEVKRRERTFKFDKVRNTEVDGAPAIEILGRQTASKRELRVRSVHLFRGHVEYVIEAIAPPSQFALVDGRVLRPLLTSLEVTGRLKKDKRRA